MPAIPVKMPRKAVLIAYSASGMRALRGRHGGTFRVSQPPPNGLELSCPAARASLPPLYGNFAGNTSSNFPHASRVSCSEVLGSGMRAIHWSAIHWSVERTLITEPAISSYLVCDSMVIR